MTRVEGKGFYLFCLRSLKPSGGGGGGVHSHKQAFVLDNQCRHVRVMRKGRTLELPIQLMSFWCSSNLQLKLWETSQGDGEIKAIIMNINTYTQICCVVPGLLINNGLSMNKMDLY